MPTHSSCAPPITGWRPGTTCHLLPTLGVFPQQVVADGDCTKREAVIGAAGRGVEYFGSWTDTSEEWTGHGIAAAYHPSAFPYDEARNEMICPEGRRLRFRTIHERAGGLRVYIYAAESGDCRRRPQRSFCTPQNAMQKHGRAMSVRVEPEAVERYHERMATDAGKAIYKQRAPVAEFPNAWLKDKLKWVRVKCRGIAARV